VQKRGRPIEPDRAFETNENGSRSRNYYRRRWLRAERPAPITLPTWLAWSAAVGINNLAKRNVPDRAWRFGPTATLSGRGDNTIPVLVSSRGQQEGNRHPQRGSRIRRHRWLQAERINVRSRKIFRDRCVGRVRLKSPDAPEFLPSSSLARSARITIKFFFRLLQQMRCGEVATKDF